MFVLSFLRFNRRTFGRSPRQLAVNGEGASLSSIDLNGRVALKRGSMEGCKKYSHVPGTVRGGTNRRSSKRFQLQGDTSPGCFSDGTFRKRSGLYLGADLPTGPWSVDISGRCLAHSIPRGPGDLAAFLLRRLWFSQQLARYWTLR